MSRTTTVDFERPPIQEVACGILFPAIGALNTAHFGLLWGSFAEEFPKTQDATPLHRQGSESLDMRPRVWFVSEDDHRLIQVQRDRFHFNWRRVEPGSEYPNFDSVYAAFTRHFASFEQFVEPAGGVAPDGFELTYINLIPVDDPAEGLAGRVLPDLAWRSDTDRFLPPAAGFQWLAEFPLVGAPGVLRVVAQSAAKTTDEVLQPIIRLELTARGPAVDSTRETMDVWFDAAHEMIIKAFVELTGPELQHDTWKRRA